MTSRDTSLFTTPRTSHFGLLVEDEDVSESERVETVSVDDGSEDKTMVGSTRRNEITPNGLERDQENAGNPADWSCAKTKPHRKSSGGTRNVGFTKGTGFPSNLNSNANSNSLNNRKTVIPITLGQLNPERTIEICNFPQIWRTSDIKKILSPFEGHYRLKWQNDTSCFIHFESMEMAIKALDELQPQNALLRPFAPENVVPSLPKPEVSQMSVENTFEIYSFPPTWHSGELHKLLAAFSGQYRLKWRHDASCYAVFESPANMEKALAEISKEVICKVRPFISVIDGPTKYGH